MRFQMANISNTGIGHFISGFGMWSLDVIPQPAVCISQLRSYGA